MQKKIIASDYDGTFRRNGRIDPEDVRKITEWQKSGHLFGFVSGRGTDFIRTINEYEVAEAGLSVDFIIMENGALVTDPMGNVLRETFVDASTCAKLAAFLKTVPGMVTFEDDDHIRRQYYGRCETPERALEVSEMVNERFGDEITCFVNYHHLNIVRKGIGKQNGVRFVLEHFGFPQDAAAVVGDDWNDLEMLQGLDGWAVETASDAIRSRVNHTCKSVGDLALTLMESEKQFL